MKGFLDNNRRFPRVIMRRCAYLKNKTRVHTCDLSEQGIQIFCRRPIDSDITAIRVSLPSNKQLTIPHVRTVWNMQQANFFHYGLVFEKLSSQQSNSLRKEVIKAAIQKLIQSITDKKTKFYIRRFFLQDLAQYMDILAAAAAMASRGDVPKERIKELLEKEDIRVLLKGYCLQLLISDNFTMHSVQTLFRMLLGTWIYQSGLLRRMIPFSGETVQFNGEGKEFPQENLGTPVLGQYFDEMYTQSPYAIAMRKREEMGRSLVLKCLNESRNHARSLVNVEMKSSAFLPRIVKELPTEYQYKICCIHCGDESKDVFPLGDLKGYFPYISFSTYWSNLFSIIENGLFSYFSELSQDVVFTQDIMDYLPDYYMEKFINTVLSVLTAGGKFIFAHQNKEKTVPSLLPEWFCGHSFVPRSSQEVTNIVYRCDTYPFCLKVESGPFQYINYFLLTKK